MAGRPSLNARSLEALGAARLAELLLHTRRATPLPAGPWRWRLVIWAPGSTWPRRCWSWMRFIAVISEVAALGQGGLEISDPSSSRTIKNLPGSWSDLALACPIHVGMMRLTPDEDSGLGIGAEYEEAVWLHQS